MISRHVLRRCAANRSGGMSPSFSCKMAAAPAVSFCARGYHNFLQSNLHCSSQQQRLILNISLFSLTLFNSNNNDAFCSCSNNNSDDNNNDDQDFISKIKAKIIEAQSINFSSIFPELIKDNNNGEYLSTLFLTKLGSQVQLAINSGIPTHLSYGFFAGYLSGLALKKFGRIASLTLGMGFVMLQTLAYHGYIDVNHEKVARQVEEILDRNGDGVVDSEDIKSVVEELRKVVGFGILDDDEEDSEKEGKGKIKAIAGGGGFGLGFLGGLRSG